MTEKYEFRLTLKKGVKATIYVAIPASLLSALGVCSGSDMIFLASLSGSINAFENWYKHTGYKLISKLKELIK